MSARDLSAAILCFTALPVLGVAMLTGCLVPLAVWAVCFCWRALPSAEDLPRGLYDDDGRIDP